MLLPLIPNATPNHMVDTLPYDVRTDTNVGLPAINISAQQPQILRVESTAQHLAVEHGVSKSCQLRARAAATVEVTNGLFTQPADL